MKANLLEYIVCFDCKGRYEGSFTELDGSEIMSGTLTCPRCRIDYPIIRGIPRLLKNIKNEQDLRTVYADSFGHQWTTYHWLRDEDEFEFFQITDLNKEALRGKVILDAGCGGGRVARFVSRYAGTFFGLDYSIAVEKAYALCKDVPNAHFVQCDVNRQPFKPNTFDFVYSHGVLHHTPNTKKSFDHLPPLVKDNGLLYIAVFRKAFTPLQWSDAFWRGIINKLPIPVTDKICGAMTYLYYLPFAQFPKRFFWFSLQKSHEVRKTCLYDWYAPTYHNEHTPEEVMGWFRSVGFSDAKYINAWPYAPSDQKYDLGSFWDSLRIGRLLGVIGRKGSGER